MSKISPQACGVWCVACAAVLAMHPLRAFSASCPVPVLEAAIPETADGSAVDLRWSSPGPVREFRAWAQWRVPEGEAVKTIEQQVTAGALRLLPSPARWRPLTLTVELQSLCHDGSRSPVLKLRQLQYDPALAATCPAPAGLRADKAARQLSWDAKSHERFEVDLRRGDARRPVVQLVVSGASAPWPDGGTGPLVSRVVRLCEAERRSPPAFLVVD